MSSSVLCIHLEPGWFQSHKKVCAPFGGVVKVIKDLSHLLLERIPHPQLPFGSGSTERRFCFTGQQQKKWVGHGSNERCFSSWKIALGVREWQGNDKSLIFLSLQPGWNLRMQRFRAQAAEQFQPNTQALRINQHMDLRSCHGLAELNWIIHFSQYYHIRAAANPSGAAVCCRLKPWPQSPGYAWLNNVKKLGLQTSNR